MHSYFEAPMVEVPVGDDMACVPGTAEGQPAPLPPGFMVTRSDRVAMTCLIRVPTRNCPLVLPSGWVQVQ